MSDPLKWTVNSLDACRQRQAETGQLQPPNQKEKLRSRPPSTRHHKHSDRARPPSSTSTNTSRVSFEGRDNSYGPRSYNIISQRENYRKAVAIDDLDGRIGMSSHPKSSEMQMTPTSGPAGIDTKGTSHYNTQARTVNSGFEILPVGTLESQQPQHQWGSADEQDTRRYSIDRRRCSDGQRNKLRKRRRSESSTREK